MGDGKYSKDDIAEALIREYLKTKKCTRTLDSFEVEKPRGERAVSRKETLRNALGLQKIVERRRRKQPDKKLPAVLDMWVEHQLKKARATEDKTEPAPVETERKKQACDDAWTIGTVPCNPATGSPTSSQPRSPGNLDQAPSPSRSSARPGRSVHSAWSLSAPSEENRSSSKSIVSQRKLSGTDTSNGLGPLADIGAEGGQYGKMSREDTVGQSKTTATRWIKDDLSESFQNLALERSARARALQEDSWRHPESDLIADDLEEDLADIDFPYSATSTSLITPVPRTLTDTECHELSPDEIVAMRDLLWGSACYPPPTWEQGFFFNRNPGLGFGLHQERGGPCGVLAAVQAHLVAQIWAKCRDVRSYDLDREAQHDAVLGALASALTLVAGSKPIKVVTCPGSCVSTMSYQQLGRACRWRPALNLTTVKSYLSSGLSEYIAETGWGIVMFLFSIVLTKGIKEIKEEMDDSKVCMTGEHGYCSQELVNLLLTGKATTNVFDGDQDCGGSRLRGISERPKFGLLTFLEWYRYVEVGSFLKSPEHPIWVVCSESHFTILFSIKDMYPYLDDRGFDLMYYDGLANQDHPIVLTVQRCLHGGLRSRLRKLDVSEDHLVPPLECVVETKWPGARVDWNGSDPIL